jgi:hypothetical protein
MFREGLEGSELSLQGAREEEVYQSSIMSHRLKILLFNNYPVSRN